jgi:hypothetical protein
LLGVRKSLVVGGQSALAEVAAAGAGAAITGAGAAGAGAAITGGGAGGISGGDAITGAGAAVPGDGAGGIGGAGAAPRRSFSSSSTFLASSARRAFSSAKALGVVPAPANMLAAAKRECRVVRRIDASSRPPSVQACYLLQHCCSMASVAVLA